VGDKVTPDQVVAQAMLPGALQTIKLAEKLGVEPKDAPAFFRLKPGERVEKGQVVAETKGFLGKFKQTITSDCTGTVENISEITGNVLVREASVPVDVKAYIQGTVADIMLQEGAIIETRGAMVQGIFGVGGERTGVIRVVAQSPDKILDAADIQASDSGKILVGGAGVTHEALTRASELGVTGIIAGGVKDSDLIKFLGYDIGVAITGQEAISLTLMVTEGFGFLNMAGRTLELLTSLEGKTASINGATQIRAGVIRPEIIVPLDLGLTTQPVTGSSGELKIGTPIRVIREPYFGRLASVTALPSQLMVVDSGTEVRVLKAKLEDGEEVVVPRANVEIIAT
jgi:biotin carboxyl carrier protein